MASPLPGVWGIDLGQCALKAIRLEVVEGNVTATAFDFIEYPKILSQPDADPDALTHEALEQFLSRNSLRGDLVVIAVPGQSGLARFVKLPPVEEKKIADIVRFEAKQQIPFPLEEVVWDFQKVGSGQVTDGFAMETEIGLFAMKKDMVSRYLQHFKDVKVEVHVVQMAPLALVNFVAHDLMGKDYAPGGMQISAAEEEEAPDKKACVVALDIGTDASNLVITDGDKIIWQRPIPLGGNHFTRALTKDLKLTFAKAEHLKRNAVKSPDLKKIIAALKTVLNDFVGEVQRSLGYFTNTHRDAEIQYMVGLGNAFRLPGLQKYLQEKLQLEVRKLQRLERAEGDEVFSSPQFVENVLSFAAAYGLALQGLNMTRLQTNLLPYEVRLERLVRGKKPWAVATAAALLIGVAGLSFGRYFEKSAVFGAHIKQALDQADDAMKKAKRFKDDFEAEKTKIEESKRSIKHIGSGREERFNWQLLYQYVNAALPKPNGDRLSPETRLRAKPQGYNTDDAKEAHKMLQQKRFAKLDTKSHKGSKELDEEFIKRHLIQINIDGMSSWYFDDLSDYFKKVYNDTKQLRGMDPREQAQIKAFAAAAGEKGDLPTKGWLVEIRGYTYHLAGDLFVEQTLLENLAVPEKLEKTGKLPKDMDEQIRKNLGYLVLYKTEKVDGPDFKIIKGSFLRLLAKGDDAAKAGAFPGVPAAPGIPGAADPKVLRDGWQALGEVARARYNDTSVAGFAGPGPGAFGREGGNFFPQPLPGPPNPAGDQPQPAAKVVRQARTEFIILFVWKEPVIESSTVPGLTPGQPEATAGKSS